jgi:hypothetical protein
VPLDGSLKAVTKKVVHEDFSSGMSAVFERNETREDGVRQESKRTNAPIVHQRLRKTEQAEMDEWEPKFDAGEFEDSRTTNIVFDGVFGSGGAAKLATSNPILKAATSGPAVPDSFKKRSSNARGDKRLKLAEPLDNPSSRPTRHNIKVPTRDLVPDSILKGGGGFVKKEVVDSPLGILTQVRLTRAKLSVGTEVVVLDPNQSRSFCDTE